MVVDIKCLIVAQRNIYKKHHIIRGILVEYLSHSKYIKIIEKFTAKAIFESLCSTYEGNQQVKDVKANQLVDQYELFRMKDDKEIKTMYSRFQTLVSGLQFSNKSYSVPDHVKKIPKSLHVRFRLKVTTI
jgi:hypothetical protein